MRSYFSLNLLGFVGASVFLVVFLLGIESPTPLSLRLQPRAVPGLDLVLLPVLGGSFTMGNTTGEPEELPLTRIDLSPFWLGQTEVTQAQWFVLMGSNPSRFRDPRNPVENVSYQDAIEFCMKLTERERAARRIPGAFKFTLPTEAQWEYACRADSLDTAHAPSDRTAWSRENSGYTTHPVAQKAPNAWGFYDMQGNVWEWCLDPFAPYPGGRRSDYLAKSDVRSRVRRGGSYQTPLTFCRSTYRYDYSPRAALDGLGFRVVLASRR